MFDPSERSGPCAGNKSFSQSAEPLEPQGRRLRWPRPRYRPPLHLRMRLYVFLWPFGTAERPQYRRSGVSMTEVNQQDKRLRVPELDILDIRTPWTDFDR